MDHRFAERSNLRFLNKKKFVCVPSYPEGGICGTTYSNEHQSYFPSIICYEKMQDSTAFSVNISFHSKRCNYLHRDQYIKAGIISTTLSIAKTDKVINFSEENYLVAMLLASDVYNVCRWKISRFQKGIMNNYKKYCS